MNILRALSTLLCITQLTTTLSDTTQEHLTLSAVVNDEAGIARIECWRLRDQFLKYPTVGKSTYLGDMSNATYVVLPPRSEEGYHKPPHPMLVTPHLKPRPLALPFPIHFVIVAHSKYPTIHGPHLVSRFFVLLSGLAHVVAPQAGQELWIVEGVNSLIVAVDTYGTGHLTFYPSDKETVALQIPFQGGEVPKHAVLHVGACLSQAEADLGMGMLLKSNQ